MPDLLVGDVHGRRGAERLSPAEVAREPWDARRSTPGRGCGARAGRRGRPARGSTSTRRECRRTAARQRSGVSRTSPSQMFRDLPDGSTSQSRTKKSVCSSDDRTCRLARHRDRSPRRRAPAGPSYRRARRRRRSRRRLSRRPPTAEQAATDGRRGVRRVVAIAIGRRRRRLSGYGARRPVAGASARCAPAAASPRGRASARPADEEPHPRCAALAAVIADADGRRTSPARRARSRAATPGSVCFQGPIVSRTSRPASRSAR